MKEIDLDIGDTILTGKWKNKRVEVESFGTDDKGQPTVNGKAMLNFRIEKLMPSKEEKVNEAMIIDEHTKMKMLAGVEKTPVQSIVEAANVSKIVREAFDAVNALNSTALEADVCVDRILKEGRDRNGHQIKEADRIFKDIDAYVKKLRTMILDEANAHK